MSDEQVHGFPLPRAMIETHDHAVLIYDEERDLLLPLDAFLAEGDRQRDLSVFVHSFPTNEAARAFIAEKVPDVPRYEREGSLTSAGYIESFEREGRIDHTHVEGVVGMLQTTAHRSGRRAPRIFVDASKNYFDSGRTDEWFAFESWLGPRLAVEAGLVCAYRAKDLRDPRVLARVLSTHEYRFDPPVRRRP